MQTKTDTANPTYLLPWIYLFFTDIIEMRYKTYAQYAAKEPGFAPAFMRAYIYAFQQPKDGRVSHDLLKNINKLSMQHEPALLMGDRDNVPGQYRSERGNIQLKLDVTISDNNPSLNINHNTTISGFRELLNYWFLECDNPTHTLGFQGTNENEDSYTYCLEYRNNQLLWTCINTRVSEIFDSAKHIPLMHKFLQNKDYDCSLFVMRNRENVQNLIEQQIDKWINSYDLAIANASTPEKKLQVIAQYIQKLDQIHPFSDGNIRTCYILLQKLLSDHNLPLCILIDPNYLDGYDHVGVVTMIIEGQALYQNLLKKCQQLIRSLEVPFTHQFSMMYRGNIMELPIPNKVTVVCQPIELNEPELLREFCHTVLGLVIPKNVNENAGSQGVFGTRNQSAHDALEVALAPYLNNDSKETSLHDALLKKNYGLVLRLTCAYGKFDMTRIVLSHRNALQIDLNAQTSKFKTALDLLNEYETKTDNELEEKNQLLNELITAGATGKITSKSFDWK